MLSTALAALAAILSLTHAAPSAAANPSPYPSHFEPPFSPAGFCPSNQTTVTAPAALVLYPVAPKTIYDIVGDFYNISWIGPTINATEGPDNRPGATRYIVGDPFVQKEELTWYALDPSTYAHQQVARTAAPVTIASGYVEEASHLTIAIRPRCGGTAAQFGFTVTFCMSGAAPAGRDLPTDIFDGAAAALRRLWTLLEIEQPFNSTASSCETVADE